MPSLLIVDDEQALRNGLAHYLAHLDSPFETIVTAENGQTALAKLERQPFAAALIDINLGDINGLDLISLINQRYPQTLVVIISGYDDFDFARRAIKLKVLDYLLKPIPRSDLKQLMTTFAQKLATVTPTEPVTNDLSTSSQSYIEAHYSDKNLSLTRCAQALFVSETHLSKQLKQTTGMTFLEYLTTYRLKKAQELLRNPRLRYTITDIANKVGYEDAHYFSRVFRKKLGQSPLQYRQH
ncbi:response regulator transcription factor [Lactiplantibacillus songbeiensis]|uniref:Helix-turn-helix domain-containing protein n=1 Tax=Lactiplantibacillus songbeiensis TaxID=2559920 RepID=A0ABW4C0B6_9LACO|nr:helix-turn-helix domain-containing protein [Lactiplantibacillus songbeiensis]